MNESNEEKRRKTKTNFISSPASILIALLYWRSPRLWPARLPRHWWCAALGLTTGVSVSSHHRLTRVHNAAIRRRTSREWPMCVVLMRLLVLLLNIQMIS